MQDFQNAENDEKAAEAGLENADPDGPVDPGQRPGPPAWRSTSARQARRDMEIRAPVPSGTPAGADRRPVTYAVAKRSVSEGQMLKQGDPVVDLVIENPLRLWTNVPERYSAEVKLGQPVRITVASHPGKTFEGKVARINPSVDPVSRTFQVEAAVPNDERPAPARRVRQGVDPHRPHVRGDGRPDRVGRPVRRRDQAVHRRGRARPAPINVETGPGRAGLGRGDSASCPTKAQVVTTGQTQLADGTPVVIREPEPAATAPSPRRRRRPRSPPASRGRRSDSRPPISTSTPRAHGPL